MATIAAGDLTKLRTKQHQATFYLSVLQPVTLLSALVNNGSITRGARSIAYDTGTGSAGNFALIQEGQTLVVITADGEKKVRVKSVTGNQVSGTITVDENSINFGNNQVISVLLEYRIWPIAPRITGGVFYKFYDQVFPGFPTATPPVAIAGPHRAGFLSAGSLAFAIDASDSYTIASGATISSYAWSCTGGTITNAAIATTTITFNTAGTYWLKLTVTDSNGKTQSTFRAIFVYDADNPPYTDFDVNSVPGSWQSGGYRAAFSVNGDVELSDFPDGTLVLLWYVGKINAAEDYVNLWPAGDNLLFSGYIRTDNDTDGYTTGAGTVEFSAVSPEGILDEVTEFGTVSITAVAAPTTWYEYASWLTVGRAVHHLLRWHSTAFSCVDIYGLTDNTLGMESASFTEQSLLQQVNSLAFNRGHFAKLASDRTGRLHFVTDSQYLNDAGRTALDTVFSITNADISGAINVTRQPEGRVGYCDLDGFSFDGSTGTAFISLAPGYIDTISISMAEFTGIGGLPVKNQVLASQTDSDEKAGRALAVENRPISEIRLEMPANYSGAFDIIPSTGWYGWGIADANLKRALALFGSNLVCRQVENRINVSAGTIQTAVILEPEAFGADGIPGNYPTAYPARPANPPDPDWNEPVVPTEPTITASAVGSYGSHFWRYVAISHPIDADAAYVVAENLSQDLPVPFYYTGFVLDCSGATPSFTQAAQPYTANGVDFVAVDLIPGTDKAVSFINSPSNALRSQVLYQSGGAVTGGATDVDGTTSPYDSLDIAALTATMAIAVFREDTGGSPAGGAFPITTNAGANSVVFGSAITFAAVDCASMSIDRLDDTRAVVVYKDNDNNGYLTAVIITESSGTLTAGSPVVLDNTEAVFADNPSSFTQKRVAPVNTGVFVSAYQRDTTGDVRLIACSVSGDVITPGTSVEVAAAGEQVAMDSYDTDKVLVVYNQSTINIMARTAAVSGTTITVHNNEITAVTSDLAANKALRALSTTRLALVWANTSASNRLDSLTLSLS